VLLAIENAPAHKRAWYGMFPQLGAPVGFFLSSGVFLGLSRLLTDKQFRVWLAAAVSGQFGAGVSGAVGAADDYGDAGVSGGASSAANR
jgi:hypothetical protein